MEQTRYLTWKYFPLHLEANEISNPILILEEFYNISSLSGHLRLLKKWRKYIINTGYYKGRNGDPSDLLMVHADTIRLIEAVFLLDGLEGDDYRLIIEAELIQRQVALEQKEWDDYPRLLSKKQIGDPMRVIKKFCRLYKLPEYREHLQEWLIYGLSVAECDEFFIAADFISIYDNLQKLFEACWLLYMRYKKPVKMNEQEPDQSQGDLA